MAKRSTRAPLVASVGAALAALVACNVFSSIDRCESDADCAGGATCDPAGRYCVGPGAEAGSPVDASDVSDAGVDAADAEPPRCDPRDPFTSFSLVKGLETKPIISARLTSDETTILFSALEGCLLDDCYDIFTARRTDRVSPFGAGKIVPAINCTTASEYWPTLSADGKLVFFESSRMLVPDAGACGNDRARIWSASRVNTSTDFDTPRIDALFAVGPEIVDSSPYLHPGGRSLYFVSLGRPGTGGQDIYVANLDALGLSSEVKEIKAVNSTETENFPVISLDERTLYFSRDGDPDGGASLARDVWVSLRASATADFGAPAPVSGLTGPDDDIPAWLSDDRCRLYFTSNRDAADAGAPLGDYHLWVAERQAR